MPQPMANAPTTGSGFLRHARVVSTTDVPIAKKEEEQSDDAGADPHVEQDVVRRHLEWLERERSGQLRSLAEAPAEHRVLLDQIAGLAPEALAGSDRGDLPFARERTVEARDDDRRLTGERRRQHDREHAEPDEPEHDEARHRGRDPCSPPPRPSEGDDAEQDEAHARLDHRRPLDADDRADHQQQGADQDPRPWTWAARLRDHEDDAHRGHDRAARGTVRAEAAGTAAVRATRAV